MTKIEIVVQAVKRRDATLAMASYKEDESLWFVDHTCPACGREGGWEKAGYEPVVVCQYCYHPVNGQGK